MNSTIRRIFLAGVSLLFGLSLTSQAGNPVLEKIQTANKSVKSLECDFTQTKKILASGRQIPMGGKLYFTSESQLSMLYDKPEGELFVINGPALYMKRDGKANVYNTDKNRRMRSLSNVLLRCIEGKAEEVAAENGADILVNSNSSADIVTIKGKPEQARGYSIIVLTYRKSDSVLTKMEMTDFSGICNIYELKDIVKGKVAPGGVFDVPATK